MDGIEDKLGQILSNPQAMQQIMSLAQALGGGQQPNASQEQSPQSQPQSAPAMAIQPAQMAPGGANTDALLKMLFDFSKNTHEDDAQLALFRALKPFVRPDRAAKIDRALQAARISRMAGAALERFAPTLFSGR